MLFFCLALILLSAKPAAQAQDFLSHLSATKDDPIYATYAAPLETSEFFVDEGYRFIFYEPERGIEFETDHAGIWSTAWRMGAQVRWRLKDMAREPVIRVTYSNLVRFDLEPFPDLLVDVFFLVYSSRIALQEITLTNRADSARTITLYPFIYFRRNAMGNPYVSPQRDLIGFNHREPPDGWTVAHGVPHVDHRTTLWMLSEPADHFGGYTRLGSVPPGPARFSGLARFSGPARPLGPAHSSGPAQVVQPNYCVEWGPIYHSDGSPCTHLPPDVSQIVLHNGSDREILTEEAPKWGDPDPNVPGNGFQGCELGHFDNPPIAEGDSFTVIFTCLARDEQGIARGRIPQLPAPAGVYVPMRFSPVPFPPRPSGLQVQVDTTGHRAILRWQSEPGLSYRIYRRTEHERGEYDLLARGVQDSVYVDESMDPESFYAYILVAEDKEGRWSPHSLEVSTVPLAEFFSDVGDDGNLQDRILPGAVTVLAFQKSFTLGPGETARWRIIRAVQEAEADPTPLYEQCRELMEAPLEPYVEADEALYHRIPRLEFDDPDVAHMYWSAFNLLRQVMMPPEGQCSYNYYLYSREPTWGWGHGGQVFHESLAMLAYVYMDPRGAMDSQRIFMERQASDGYIPYRVGPYLNETIPWGNQLTSSAPWFNWENWELFRITGDTTFLEEAYESGKKFYNFWITHRDSDGDGLCEWGAHAVLECVRDGKVAVWDQVGWPSHFECLDLNTLLVVEAQSLAQMAEALGRADEARLWQQEAQSRAERINQLMWDPQDEFYYHVDKEDHDFTHRQPNDLKRKEIIGFLPLWAGIARQEQAEALIRHLLDPSEFWREYGVPSLAANDPYYNPVGYWNGPVWVQWNYLIFRGLLNYGCRELAAVLARKVFDAVITQLKTTHTFWEIYSPDSPFGGHHQAYIWTGLVARMAIDLADTASAVRNSEPGISIASPALRIYPNPASGPIRIVLRVPSGSSKTIHLEIFDLLGRRVRRLEVSNRGPGSRVIFWDGRDEKGKVVPAGIYFCRVQVGKHILSQKIIKLWQSRGE